MSLCCACSAPLCGGEVRIGFVGGQICLSQRLLEAVRSYIAKHGTSLLIGSYISHTGDDIAIVMTHTHGVRNAGVHTLAWVPSWRPPGPSRIRACWVPARTT